MIINDKSRVISDAISRFMKWLEKYGEISYDHQTFFAGRVGKHAKSLYYKNPILGTISVAPIIFCEAYMPMLRPMFHYKQRFPIADAHYAMGYALLAKITDEKLYYRKAVHFLEELMKSRAR